MVLVFPVSNPERDLEGLNVELITIRAREAICSRLHTHESLKYNLLILCLNRVGVHV